MTSINLINSPQELKKMNPADLNLLAANYRRFLIESISKTGGHIGANLGVIELTLAIHYVFDSPRDPIIFDTGHQGYTHKLLTGRQGLFTTLNSYGGLNRFLARQESEHDIIDASHAGTSLALATGMAWSLHKENSNRHVVAVIGDGSLVEGMASEGLNFAAGKKLKLIIVLNDNGMAIAPNIGGIKNLTGTPDWLLRSKAFFEGLGLEYIPVEDGHNINQLLTAFKKAKELQETVLVHVKTEKGRGLPCAKDHPYKMHFSMPFDPQTGLGSSATVTGKTYATVAAEVLTEAIKKDKDLFVITPATPYASGLDNLLRDYPEQVFDVGMAEQHAVGMACGLALEGRKAVVCMQTTFMQRAFDQILHDVCYMNLPVTILGVRAGFAGYDSPTHHGLYDLPYMRSFPNMQLIYPASSHDMRSILYARMQKPVGPMVILHPYEPIVDPEVVLDPTAQKGIYSLAEGGHGMILTLGNCINEALKLRKMLKDEHKFDFGLACVTHLKPLPLDHLLPLLKAAPRIVTIEESTLPGGFGSLICETLNDHRIAASVLRTGVADRFVPPGTKEECSLECGIDANTLLRRVLSFWPELKK